VDVAKMVAREGLGSWDTWCRLAFNTPTEENKMARNLCTECNIRPEATKGTDAWGQGMCAPCHSGSGNTVPKTRGSHATCTHPVTPKARAACRKARNA
jgi:hypothetical protein